jgi:hypothetical protein
MGYALLLEQTPSKNMQRKTTRRTLATILAVVGTVLVWLPLLAPLFFSFMLWSRARMWRLDYLMPAELFFLVLAGAVALIAAAILARSRLKLIAGAFAAAVALLVGAQALAVITGLASGETEIGGWQWGLVVAGLAGYIASVIVMGVGGALLVRDLLRREPRLPPDGRA